MHLMGKYRGLLLIIDSLLAAALIALGYSGQLARAQDTAAEAQDQGAQDNSAGACDQTTQAAAKARDFNARQLRQFRGCGQEGGM
jgi:hypothetical protein